MEVGTDVPLLLPFCVFKERKDPRRVFSHEIFVISSGIYESLDNPYFVLSTELAECDTPQRLRNYVG